MKSPHIYRNIFFNLALFLGSLFIAQAFAQLPMPATQLIDTNNVTVTNLGVQLNADFSETGGFTIPLQVQPSDLNQFQQSLDHIDCSITSPTPLCCLCENTTVVPGSSGALDVAIAIDSSGSNVLPPSLEDPAPASDPTNLRLTAAQQVVETLLTGDTHVAAYNFGTLYCNMEPCPPSNPARDFYRLLERIGDTYRFSNGYVDASQKETVKSNLAKAIWEENNFTPLYGALREIMNDMAESIQRSSTKIIVVFSDGKPSDGGQSMVCDQASSMGVKILSIGYGEASEINANSEPEAVQVLKDLANCSAGTYLAIEDINTIAQQAQNLAASITQGHIDLNCNLSDPSQILTPGEDMQTVEGTAALHLTNSTETNNVSFSFVPSGEAPRTLPGYEDLQGAECPVLNQPVPPPTPHPTPTPQPTPPPPNPQPVTPPENEGGLGLFGGGCGGKHKNDN